MAQFEVVLVHRLKSYMERTGDKTGLGMDFQGVSISFLYPEKGTDPTGHPELQSCSGCSPGDPPGQAFAVLQGLSHISVPLQSASMSFFLSHCSVDDTTLITNVFLQSPNKLNIMNIMATTFSLLKKKNCNKV